MSIQSDAAKKHIEKLLSDEYDFGMLKQSGQIVQKKHIEKLLSDEYDATDGKCDILRVWVKEHKFDALGSGRKWRFDYAVPMEGVAIELDGGTFMAGKSGHASGVGLRGWREKNNAAMTAGWRVWHYAPEEIIKAGRKTLPDEPVLLRLPWLERRAIQRTI